MNTAIDEHDVTVYLGDAVETLAGMDAGSVQCIVTSPPYYGLRDYGVDGQLGLEASPAEYVAAIVHVFAEARRVLADDGVLWLNLGDTYSTGSNGTNGTSSSTLVGHGGEGTEWDRGSSFKRGLIGRPKNLIGIPWRVAFGLQDDGWTLRNAVIWHKTNAMPESVTDRLSTRHEYVFLLAKSQRYWFDLDAIREPVTGYQSPRALSFARDTKEADVPGQSQRQHRQNRTPRHTVSTDNTGWKNHSPQPHANGKNPGDVWTIPTSPFPGAHFACMPPELARRCISAGCTPDGTVLDPFAGSGTTLMVARSLGRKSVGIELNPEYVGIIRDRIGPTPFDFAAGSSGGVA